MKKVVSLILCLAILASTCISSFAAEDLSSRLNKTSSYLLAQNKTPGPGDLGGDWTVIGLARGTFQVPGNYYTAYYESLVSYLEANKGVLSAKKYTEYSRTIIALSAIGADPANVSGYNLLEKLADFNAVKWQGLNGPVWALIALDSASYEIPENKDAEVQATRQMYVDYILSMQLEDGGFSLSGKGNVDIDLTAMTLQALAKYRNQEAVEKAIDRALACLSAAQKPNGLFDYSGSENCETMAQVLVALCELGISPQDPRFVKNGNTVLAGMLSFALDDASFEHFSGNGANQMATEQAFYAMVALKRFKEGKNSLYRMGDAECLVETSSPVDFGLPGKSGDVKFMAVTKPELSFSDIDASSAKEAILALASRGIISGMGEGTFKPDETMTRAQFAAIVTLGLGLEPQKTTGFADIKSTAWYAGFVGTASKYNIVSGRSTTSFDPEATITKQEAAIMVAKAAKLCGMNTEMDATATRNILAQFGDYTKAAAWAQPYLAFCYSQDILNQSELNIEPIHQVTRAEIAQMLYNMLEKAKLL